MYLTRKQTAEYLQCSLEKLRTLTAAGKIDYYKQGGRVLYTPADLDRYMESCKVTHTVKYPYDTYRKRRNLA